MNRTDVIPSLVLSAYALGRIAAQDAGNDAPAAQWRVLSLLEQAGSRRVGELAAAARTTQPGMTRLLGGLEREGLILRSPDPDDSRATVVDITAQGDLGARRLASRVPRHSRSTLRRSGRRGVGRPHTCRGDPRRAYRH
ncbi:MarR family transcriptional regulator [Microbacterium oxydans]|nr:MarR family transcriptional regulator [Microbacterium oxydans]